MARFIRFVQVFITTVTILALSAFYTQAAFAKSTQNMQVLEHNQICPQLPPNFDPERASLSELKYFHLPPPPADMIQRAAWVKELKHIKHIDCDSSFTSLNEKSHILPTRKLARISGVTANDITSQNWSGYYVKNDTFDNVQGNWNTQCLGSNQNSNVRLVTWIGIGGVNEAQLWQAGTIYASDGLYHPWWEAFPNNDIQIDWNIAGVCGNPVSTNVYYSNGNWCYYVNFDGFVASGCPINTSAFFADESTAEWVDERPSCNNSNTHLADFNFTSWSNTYAHSTIHNWHTLLGFQSDKVHMQDQNNGNILAESDSPSSATTFTDRYKNRDTDGVNCNIL